MIDRRDISTPSALNWMKEARALVDFSSVSVSFAKQALMNPEAKQRGENALPIIMFPGFASDDKYLLPLRAYLKRLGYKAEGWGLGRNLAGANYEHSPLDLDARWGEDIADRFNLEDYRGEASVPYLCDRAIERVQQRSKELNSPVVLVGWSLGGFVAREVARELTDQVHQVITFGSPVVGGPKYTSAAGVFKARGQDMDFIEEEIDKREERPIQQPITAIYSKSDGIVSWQAALDHSSPNVEHIEVNAAHLGMGFNREVWKLVLEALDKHNR